MTSLRQKKTLLSAALLLGLLVLGGLGTWFVRDGRASGPGTARESAVRSELRRDAASTTSADADAAPGRRALELAGAPEEEAAPPARPERRGPPEALTRLRALAEEPFRPAGRVVDPEGEAVVGARVHFFEQWGANPFDPLPGRRLEVLVTDETGQFRATRALPAGRAGCFLVEHADWARELAGPVDPLAPETAFTSIALGPGGRLEGRVLGARGDPLSGAEVTVRDPSVGIGPLRGREEVVEATVHTGPDGRFAVQGLSLGDKRLVIRAVDHATLRTTPIAVSGRPGRVHDLRLRSGGRLAGRVVEKGTLQGLADLPVTVRPVGRPGVASDSSVVTTRTGPGGHFRLEGLVPGTLVVAVERPGVGGTLRVNAATGTEDLVIPVDAGASLAVHVLSADDGAPVTDFEIDLVPARQGRRLARGTGTAVHSETGEHRFRGVRPGWYRALLAAPGFGPLVSDPVEVREDGAEVLVLRPDLGITVTGAVTDAAGRPVAGARVVIEHEPEDAPSARGDGAPMRFVSAIAHTRGDGSWVATDLGPGDYRLAVSASGFAPYAGEPFALVVTAEPIPAPDVVLDAAGRITGQVLDEEGRPDPRALVSVAPAGAGSEWRAAQNAATGSDGRFSVDGLVPGRYFVRLLRREGRMVVRSALRVGTDDAIREVSVTADRDATLVLGGAR